MESISRCNVISEVGQVNIREEMKRMTHSQDFEKKKNLKRAIPLSANAVEDTCVRA